MAPEYGGCDIFARRAPEVGDLPPSPGFSQNGPTLYVACRPMTEQRGTLSALSAYVLRVWWAGYEHEEGGAWR